MSAQIQKIDMAAQRTKQRLGFLNNLNLPDGAPLAQDASVRQFFRVTKKDGTTAILMDARPPLEDTKKYVLMREKLDAIGLSVPKIYAADHAQGFILMEDFGDIRFYEHVTQNMADINMLYELATDALVHKLQADPGVALKDSIAYSDEYWLFRIEQFLLHYMPQILKREATQTERDDLLGIFHELLTASHQLDDVLLHGDFGAQNLYYLPEREDVKALGLIDFQDMTDARGNMMGSPAFDLVFLLQDVRVDLPAALEEAMCTRFIEKTSIRDKDVFMGEYAVIGAAQAVKCLGLFARLGYGEGREEYKNFIPYCWRNLSCNLVHPSLQKVADWFNKNGIEIEKGS